YVKFYHGLLNRCGKRRRGKMAAPREAAVAQRIDPAREPGLSPEQRRFMAQVELAQRQRALQKRLRGRNVLLALGIGGAAPRPHLPPVSHREREWDRDRAGGALWGGQGALPAGPNVINAS
uniref:Uncharacterized protein n=1 Tax=Anas platyrhynchos platyrhynchos TaxID=8840 RepID=A0A493T271_ANAPP